MKKNLLLLASSFLIFGVSATAQNEKNKQLPSVAIGAGVLSFNGDVGGGSLFSKIRTGINLTIEQRIGKFLGVSLNGIYGKLADSENGNIRNLNFESKIIQADLNVVLHFDNDFILSRSSTFAPFITIGLGYLQFDPYGDLKDKSGTPYNYWNDGTIRSIAQTDTNSSTAKIIHKDYTYESKLTDSTTKYSRSTFALPIGLGFNLKLSDKVNANIGATYYLTFSDWIDNYKSGSNDKYLYANISLQYNFGKPYDDSDPIYRSVNFSSLDKQDTDGDGVKDENDRCPGTPTGVKVNSKGCPEDTDLDGVPDYRDKEANTKKGAIVDENGIAQTDKMFADKQAQYDSLATERSQLFNENPSLSYLKDVENKANEARKNNPSIKKDIPYALRPADLDSDGIISTDEIAKAIENFFEADSDFTVEKLNDLIDFFFEQ